MFHQELEILSSSNITIHLSLFVLISRQNHCFNFKIALGIEYSEKESLKKADLA
ncbi:MAG: hypothetical protein LBC61_06575 [Candidatus Peribacteria bacterium]|nr:hypothetical protein [Candidatus Peribacteria bacterium]